MREIVLDTETTGLEATGEDRIVEIGCVELENHLPTGRTYHQYINPERDMPDEAYRVHGLSEAFLADYPVFAEIAEAFIEFVGDAALVIHNAEFDMGFINAELMRTDRPAIPLARAVDTLMIARKRFPGSPASLDALCRRFGVDNAARTKHGALLDSELLAEVYLELIGGRQQDLALQQEKADTTQAAAVEREYRPPRPHAASSAELAAHEKLVDGMSEAIWRR
ncbi:MAG TPA: DNA polymerase III subunit epsilon [Rhodospirillaceae bacterium]|nr:DNA polymerase III subunit epsilon [Rhodospirillaceae bacterium]HAA92344.1 DNA polymerase III subunit epsilon [Rhodospirillaceae bacterium]HAT35102.1 DNA polymerase III subunit epsilon [Rhodospirillaceae bacterium]